MCLSNFGNVSTDICHVEGGSLMQRAVKCAVKMLVANKWLVNSMQRDYGQLFVRIDPQNMEWHFISWLWCLEAHNVAPGTGRSYPRNEERPYNAALDIFGAADRWRKRLLIFSSVMAPIYRYGGIVRYLRGRQKIEYGIPGNRTDRCWRDVLRPWNLTGEPFKPSECRSPEEGLQISIQDGFKILMRKNEKLYLSWSKLSIEVYDPSSQMLLKEGN